MKFDNNKIQEHKLDFTYFKGFVPPILIGSSRVSITERDQFLKEVGLYEEDFKKLQEFKRMMDTVDNPADYEVEEILKFIEENPQFKDILIDEPNKFFNELLSDKPFLLKNVFYSLVFAELTLKNNFKKDFNYSSTFLNILENIKNELKNNPKNLNKPDLKDINSFRKYFSLKNLDLNTANNINTNFIKIFPILYLYQFESEFIFDAGKKLKYNPKYPFNNHIDNGIYYTFYSLYSTLYENYEYAYLIISRLFLLFIDKYDSYRIEETHNLGEITSYIIDNLEKSCVKQTKSSIKLTNDVYEKIKDVINTLTEEEIVDLDETNLRYYDFKKLFENPLNISKEDIENTEGIVNTIYSIIYSLNSSSFIDCITKAINLENELYLTTALTAMIAGSYFKIDKDYNECIPLIDNSQSYITLNNSIDEIDYLEKYLDNFEYMILKEQLSQVISFIPFFKEVKESDCYEKDNTYPMYPNEMTNFSNIVHHSLISDRYVHSHYDKITEKYISKNCTDYPRERKYLVEKSNFHELKVILAEYLRAEHMCEGWWSTAIDEKIFYNILIKLKEYHDSITIYDFFIPSEFNMNIDFDNAIGDISFFYKRNSEKSLFKWHNGNLYFTPNFNYNFNAKDNPSYQLHSLIKRYEYQIEEWVKENCLKYDYSTKIAEDFSITLNSNYKGNDIRKILFKFENIEELWFYHVTNWDFWYIILLEPFIKIKSQDYLKKTIIKEKVSENFTEITDKILEFYKLEMFNRKSEDNENLLKFRTEQTQIQFDNGLKIIINPDYGEFDYNDYKNKLVKID